jgi:hypothetical protein
MSSFVVVKYFNYRKEITINVVGYTKTLESAKEVARELAEQDEGDDSDDVIEGEPEDQYVWVENTLVQYYKGDGYCRYIFAVTEAKEF